MTGRAEQDRTDSPFITLLIGRSPFQDRTGQGREDSSAAPGHTHTQGKGMRYCSAALRNMPERDPEPDSMANVPPEHVPLPTPERNAGLPDPGDFLRSCLASQDGRTLSRVLSHDPLRM